MFTANLSQLSLSHAAKIAALAAALSVNGIAVSAEELPGAPQSFEVNFTRIQAADLEEFFWVCDYAATKHGSVPADMCSTATEELKGRKFSGDFEAMLQWWQENKIAQHRRLDTGYSNSAGFR
jgi:hypothetical protein